LTTIWDEAGQKRTAMTYKNAKPRGREVRWDESGNVAKVIDHGSN
jgi:antitoxin component YwqK of YwqJK toxin-antitoxin module